ncbi:MAG: mechanosensitive ion channel family protein [Nitrospirales bacterium]|nr:mechanosensitive ion channel family protein [Nitrospirales bacterium]
MTTSLFQYSSSIFLPYRKLRRIPLLLLSLIVLWIMIVSVGPLPALAQTLSALQEKPQEPPQEKPQEKPNDEMVVPHILIPTAPVILDGDILFQVRGVSALPAEERARRILERIDEFGSDLSRSTQSLRLVEEKGVTMIFAGDQPLMGVTNADGRLEGGVEREVLARIYLKRIAEAVETHREKRKPINILIHIAFSLLATAILGSAWWGTRWIFDKLDTILEPRYKERVKDLKVQKVIILQAHQMWAGLRGGIHGIKTFLLFLLLYAYLNFVFRQFPWTAHIGKQLFNILLDPIRVIVRGFLSSFPSLVFLVILIILLRYLLKFGKLIFANLSIGKVTWPGFDREWAWPTYRIFRTLVIAFGIVVGYPYIPGSTSEAFKGITIFLGVLLSLGSSSIIGNILAGYTLVYRRAFQEGDRIKVNEILGDVIERRILTTRLRSLKNEEIIVPNSEILNSHVTNYSAAAREKGLILHTTVGIGYETPWRQVEAMLIEAADRTSGLLKDPRPFVLQLALGDFCVTYELNVYCDRPYYMMDLYTGLSQNILDVFNEHRVQVMTPAYMADPPQPKIVPKDQWFTPPAKLPEKPRTSET